MPADEPPPGLFAAKDAKDAKQRPVEPSLEADVLARAIVGAAIAVHKALGPGYLEAIYERALAIELDEQGIPFERQVGVPVVYRGILVGEHRIDLLVGGLVIVEVKAIASVPEIHYSQVISYLRATNLDLALILNFNARTLVSGMKRIVRST